MMKNFWNAARGIIAKPRQRRGDLERQREKEIRKI